MSFIANKTSNFSRIESVDDLMSRDINQYFTDVDKDLQNLFYMATPNYQFGVGEAYQVIQYTTNNNYGWSGELGGWSVGGDLLWAGVSGSYIALKPGTGIWLGDESILAAPFSVDPAGVLTAHSGEIAGWTISDTKLAVGGEFDYDYMAFTPGTGIQIGRYSFSTAPFSVTKEGVLKAISGTIGGWTLANDKLSGGSGANYIALQPGTGIYAGAESFGSAGFSVDGNGNMKASLATITAPLIQTNSNPGTNRVIIDSAGLRGYDDTLGLTFKILTDGNPPLFANGLIQYATITDSTFVSNEFKSSSELPWVEMTDTGVAYRETVPGAVYNDGTEYGDGTLYGVGVTGYFGNSAKPLVSVEKERTLADIRLYNRGSDPSGAAVIGDLMCKSGILYICTTDGTPGTYTKVGLQT